jgi:hypothetical protein
MPKPEKNSGFICLHRSIREHWIYEDPIKLKWWLDILMECNHADQKVSIGFQVIECKRGQSINSLPTWAKRWMVNENKVRRFFKMLSKDNMIVTEDVKKTTRLTVCNYDDYNSKRQALDTQATRIRHVSDTQATANNNANNDNNVNNDKQYIDGAYGSKEREEFVKFEKWIVENTPRVAQMKEPFTIKNFLDLKKKFPVEKITEMLESMHNYEPLIRKNRSANLTILKWLKKENNAAHKPAPIVKLDKPGTSEARIIAAKNW